MRKIGTNPWHLITFWAAFWTALGALFLHADHNGWALCRAVRHLFRTHTRSGRVGLWAFLGTGTIALGRHLVKQAAD